MMTRDFKREASVLRALANESRLRIVARLEEGEACVCELTEMLALDQSTVSKHLTVLKSASIVDGQRRGNHIYYRLLATCVLGFLACVTTDGEGTEKSDGHG
ncbi:metalloregulator ArsR/SmtB family transcription factor [bacterium]|nr:metalloregulator ArsR/SmtB family transcription factor [bacterium]